VEVATGNDFAAFGLDSTEHWRRFAEHSTLRCQCCGLRIESSVSAEWNPLRFSAELPHKEYAAERVAMFSSVSCSNGIHLCQVHRHHNCAFTSYTLYLSATWESDRPQSHVPD